MLVLSLPVPICLYPRITHTVYYCVVLWVVICWHVGPISAAFDVNLSISGSQTLLLSTAIAARADRAELIRILRTVWVRPSEYLYIFITTFAFSFREPQLLPRLSGERTKRENLITEEIKQNKKRKWSQFWIKLGNNWGKGYFFLKCEFLPMFFSENCPPIYPGENLRQRCFTA